VQQPLEEIAGFGHSPDFEPFRRRFGRDNNLLKGSSFKVLDILIYSYIYTRDPVSKRSCLNSLRLFKNTVKRALVRAPWVIRSKGTIQLFKGLIAHEPCNWVDWLYLPRFRYTPIVSYTLFAIISYIN
jgi:hypothetical protein